MNFTNNTLNRWQKMRLVALAIGCGANPTILSSSSSSSPANTNNNTTTAFEKCICCASTSFIEKRIPFDSPSRSLVDKHFDAIAQSMSELNIEWGVRSSKAGSSQDLILEFDTLNTESSSSSSSTSSSSALCFLCSLAQQLNTKAKAGDENNNSNKPWWWQEKFSSDYINMETGDIGPFDPVQDYVQAPLRSWTENTRYFLSATCSRLSKLVLKPVQAFDEETGDVSVQEPGEKEQELSQKFAKLSEQFGTGFLVVTLFSSSSGDVSSVELQDKLPEGHQGFNRSKIILPSSDFKTTFEDTIMTTPLDYSNFLFRTITSITTNITQKLIVQDEDFKNMTSSSQATCSKIAAALTASVFSDSRRRQMSNNDQQQFQQQAPMAALPAGLNLPPGVMIPGLTTSVGQPQSSSSSSAISPQQQEANNTLSMIMASRKSVAAQGEEETKTKEHEETTGKGVEDILAKIEQKKQMMMMTGQTQQPQSLVTAPAPPFLLPLSFYEEMLVLGTANTTISANNNHIKCSFIDEWKQLRSRVELESHEEKELTNPMYQKPTYIGELGNALKQL